jgi:hypothetical protein
MGRGYRVMEMVGFRVGSKHRAEPDARVEPDTSGYGARPIDLGFSDGKFLASVPSSIQVGADSPLIGGLKPVPAPDAGEATGSALIGKVVNVGDTGILSAYDTGTPLEGGLYRVVEAEPVEKGLVFEPIPDEEAPESGSGSSGTAA